jgi:hypothetical protein
MMSEPGRSCVVNAVPVPVMADAPKVPAPSLTVVGALVMVPVPEVAVLTETVKTLDA